VTATHHYITTGAYFGQFEESQSIAISPDGTLAAVPVHFTNANGMPVFDTTGIPHFVAPVYMSHGAIFSPGSDTLFVGGSYGLRPNLQGALFVTNSRTGDVWRRIDFGNDHPNRVALDPIGPWIYVVTDYHEGRVGEAPPVLYVIDRSTLNVVGRIPLRGWIDCTPYCDPVVVPGTDGLFVVTRDRIARFVRK
jgi:DNA-binding beta-propeller fold protein YncE